MRIELPPSVWAAARNVNNLPVDQQQQMLETLSEYYEYRKHNKLYYYDPDPPFYQFFQKGHKTRMRGLIAANRVGKTYGTTYEVACHATGIYPSKKTHGWDWPGLRYKRPTKGWVLGYTMESICSPDNIRDLLIGKVGEWGTGWIPKHLIENISFNNEGKGLIKEISITHISGAKSSIGIRFYSQGMSVLMGANLDYFMIDESPKDDLIFPQMVTRIQKAQDKKGRGMVSATPEFGLQPLIEDFVDPEGKYHSGYVSCTVWDVSHISDKDIATMKGDYPKHQWDMRLKGLPTLGSGSVYPFEQENVEYEDIKIEDHWKVIVGVDFGWNHPAAVAFVAYNPDNDCIYIFAARKQTEWSLPEMAAFINSKGYKCPVIWPHDGANGTQAGDGVGIKDQLLSYGCNMASERFHNPPDTATGAKNNSVEAGLSHLRTLFKLGQLKIHRSLKDVWDEYRTYHYDAKTGKPVKTNDDLMDAIRYAVQSVVLYGTSKNDDQLTEVDYHNYVGDDNNDDYVSGY